MFHLHVHLKLQPAGRDEHACECAIADKSVCIPLRGSLRLLNLKSSVLDQDAGIRAGEEKPQHQLSWLKEGLLCMV